MGYHWERRLTIEEINTYLSKLTENKKDIKNGMKKNRGVITRSNHVIERQEAQLVSRQKRLEDIPRKIELLTKELERRGED